MSINFSLHLEYSSRMTIVLYHSVCSSCWEVDGDDFASVLAVHTRLRSMWSSWDVFGGALALTIADTWSFRCPSTLRFSNSCCFVVALVTRMNNGRFGEASITSFEGKQPFVTGLGLESNCRRLFAIAVTMTGATERESEEFCFATRTLFKCFIVDRWWSAVSGWLAMFAPCKLCFLSTAIADPSRCFKMTNGDDFRTATFCSSFWLNGGNVFVDDGSA